MALTKKDFEIINSLIKKNGDDLIQRLVEYMDARFSTVADLDEVKATIKFLPTKDEFFSTMDALSGELKTSREEREVQGYQLSNHSDRLETIETKLALNT